MVLDVIEKRRSIRKFEIREVEEKKIKEILKAAMYSPSAMHLRPWEFFIVRDKGIKEKLSRTTPWCSFVKDAPVVIIIAAKPTKRWVEDCAIAAENIYLEATNQGLGTCFCQVMDENTEREEYVKNITKIPRDLRILCMMPIGYPAEKKEKHSENEFDESKVHYL
ncbi:MAG: nitroreductase family protein [Candidatus Aenigmatarchaeota archaeon]